MFKRWCHFINIFLLIDQNVEEAPKMRKESVHVQKVT